MKNKVYRLKRKSTPIAFMIPGRGNSRNPLLYWDDDRGENRPLRYARNQKTPFEDEQDGNAVVEPIVFEDGFLHVPKTNPVLQEFLHYHPMNGVKYEEVNEERDAGAEVEQLNLEVDALVECKNMSIEALEHVSRILLGIDPSRITTSELRRDMLIYVRRDPETFLRVVNDPDLKLQSKIQRFFDDNLLSYRRNKTEIWFNGPTNKKKLVTIPFGEDPVALATSYLLSDEGLDHLRALDVLISE
ncbi:hypothetical protein N9242_04070 [Vicingaceae bacterium]|nr:hypothetical protein [Vicingaceae bacterium]